MPPMQSPLPVKFTMLPVTHVVLSVVVNHPSLAVRLIFHPLSFVQRKLRVNLPAEPITLFVFPLSFVVNELIGVGSNLHCAVSLLTSGRSVNVSDIRPLVLQYL